MARYFSSQLVKPISQYAPAPLKYIDEAGQALQSETDRNTLAVDALQQALNIKGGYKTQQRAKDLVNEYKPQLDAVAAELSSTGNISGGIGKVSKLINDLKANPEYQDVMADQAKLASGEVDKLITQPGFNTYVQDIIDPTTQKFKQTKKGERFDDRWYQAVQPGDTNKEFKPLYDQVKPVIDRIYNTPVVNTWEDENGAVHTQTLQEGVETESIRKEQVRAALQDYFANDPNALNKQSLIYNKALNEKAGKTYTTENALEDVTNAFLGAYNTEKEIQKLGADKITRLSKAAAAKRGSGDNRTLNIIKEANATGGATVNAAEQAALLNGSFNKDNNTVRINAQDRTIYLNTAKTGTPEEIQKSVTLNKAIPLKVKENELVERAEENVRVNILNNLPDITPLPGTGTGSPPIVDSKGSSYYKEKGSLGSYMIKPKGAATYHSLSYDEMKKTELYKVALKGDLDSNPEYANLQKDAKAQGIDLSDESLNKNLKENTKTTDALNTLNVALTGINGELTMIPGSGKNTFTDDNGDLLVKGDAFISKEQMEEQIAPTGTFWTGGYKNLTDAGLIKPHTLYTTNKQTGEQIKTDGYIMKVITPVVGQDVENITRNIDVNRWGEAKWVADNVPLNVSQVKDELFRVKTEKQISKFQKEFTKNPNQYITDWDLEFNQFLYGKATDPEGNPVPPPNLTDQERGDLNTYKVSILENKKLTPKDKAKELFKIKMALTDPQGYNLLFGAQPEDVGKSQEGWTKTPASPLKK